MLAAPRERFVTARHALYFTPAPEGAWARFGRDWLARYGALTGEPRRYGFHATLKAPFRLAPGTAHGDLTAQLDRYCAGKTAFALGRLEVRRLGDLLAAVPVLPDPRIEAIAADCACDFDRFRAPLTDEELARRRRSPLNARQEAHLARWGYPYVLEEFRFHFTLTGSLGKAERVAREARQALAELADTPLLFDAISVVVEPAQGAAFREMHRSPLRRAGRLIYVVGPSGAGKDSVIAWVRDHLPADSALGFARRTITRPVRADGEQHDPVTDMEFAALVARGDFALHWEANGHRYGIGRDIVDQLAAGMSVVVCGSRAYLPRARLAFPKLEVVHVTAPPQVRLKRLARRGREGSVALSERLARAIHVAEPALELVNDRAIEDSGARLLRYLLG